MSKQNVLFLVHVEEMFRYLFPDNMYPLRLTKACQAKKYDKVFVMVSCVNDDQPIRELEHVTCQNQYIDWGWGYEHCMFNEEEQKFVIDANGHEFTWVPPELRDMQEELQESNVFIGGGYERECLQDFVDVLDHLDIPHKKVRGYIY